MIAGPGDGSRDLEFKPALNCKLTVGSQDECNVFGFAS